MPKARAKKSKFIVRKSKKTGKQIKLYGAPMAKVLASEKLRKRRNGAKRAAAARRRNVEEGFFAGGVFHPIRASRDYSSKRAGEKVDRRTKTGKRGATVTARRRALKASKTGVSRVRRNARSQTSRRPFDAIIGATPAAQFASTLGLANPRKKILKAFEVLQYDYGTRTYKITGHIFAPNKKRAVAETHKEPLKGRGAKIGKMIAGKTMTTNPRRKRRNPLGAMLLGVNGRGAARRKTNRRRRNGEGGLFEEFHGRPADGYKVGLAPIGTPKDTEFLGKLECIEYRNGSKSEMSFGHGDHDQPDLVANRTGKHLYLVGDIPCWPDKADQFHGYVTRIEYHAIKDHIDGGIKTLYFHKVGEETGALPELWTDTEGYLVLKGGEYYVTADGIIN